MPNSRSRSASWHVHVCVGGGVKNVYMCTFCRSASGRCPGKFPRKPPALLVYFMEAAAYIQQSVFNNYIQTETSFSALDLAMDKELDSESFPRTCRTDCSEGNLYVSSPEKPSQVSEKDVEPEYSIPDSSSSLQHQTTPKDLFNHPYRMVILIGIVIAVICVISAIVSAIVAFAIVKTQCGYDLQDQQKNIADL